MIKIGCTVQVKAKMFSAPHAPNFDHLQGKFFEVIKVADTHIIVKNLADPTDVVALEQDHVVLSSKVDNAPSRSSPAKASNYDIRRQLGWFMK